MGELRRVVAIAAGIAAILLGIIALLFPTDPDVGRWLAGAAVAAGAGLIAAHL